MWLQVRFLVYWFLCAALIPVNAYYYFHLSPDDMTMFCLVWWSVSLCVIPVLESLYYFERRVEERVLSHHPPLKKNSQKAQEGELSMSEDKVK